MGTVNVYIVTDLKAFSSGKSPGHCVALDNGHRCLESIFERKKIIALSLLASKQSSWDSSAPLTALGISSQPGVGGGWF